MIGLYEASDLVSAQERFFEQFDLDHRFTAIDLCSMHGDWLGEIYPFAGKLRTVNIGKSGVQFASVQFLEGSFLAFESNCLGLLTPCRESSLDVVAEAIAKVHGEFIALHPFREGNGRLGRWLSDAMAIQAGLPFPRYNFNENDVGGYRARYLSGVKRAMVMDYRELNRFFSDALAQALEEASEDQPR